MAETIKKFFNEVNRPELIEKGDSICFLYNATKINRNAQTKVENFFKNDNPIIMVNDVKNLIGI